MAEVKHDDNQMGELFTLAQIIIDHKNFIQSMEPTVHSVIEQADPNMRQSLHDAKEAALANDIVNELDSVEEMSEFLNSVVLIEDTLNEAFEPFKATAEELRDAICPGVGQYGEVQTLQSEITSFVKLSFDAYLVQAKFQAKLSQVEKALNDEGITFEFSGSHNCLKGNSRSFYKVFYVYGGRAEELTDILRGSFVFEDLESVYKAVKIIEELWSDCGGILRMKDRFIREEVPFGYRDLMINVLCPDTKIITEVQLHLKALQRFKKVSHRMYVKARLFENEEGRNLAYEHVAKFTRPLIERRRQKAEEDNLPAPEFSSHTSMMLKQIQSGGIEEVPWQDHLTSWKLAEFIEKFEEEGFTDVQDWAELEREYLEGTIGMKYGQILRFKRNLNELVDDSDPALVRRELPMPADDSSVSIGLRAERAGSQTTLGYESSVPLREDSAEPQDAASESAEPAPATSEAATEETADTGSVTSSDQHRGPGPTNLHRDSSTERSTKLAQRRMASRDSAGTSGLGSRVERALVAGSDYTGEEIKEDFDIATSFSLLLENECEGKANFLEMYPDIKVMGVKTLEVTEGKLYIRASQATAAILVDTDILVMKDSLGVELKTWMTTTECDPGQWQVGLKFGRRGFFSFDPGYSIVPGSACVKGAFEKTDIGFVPAPNVMHEIKLRITRKSGRVTITDGEDDSRSWSREFPLEGVIGEDHVLPARSLGLRMENKQKKEEGRVGIFGNVEIRQLTDTRDFIETFPATADGVEEFLHTYPYFRADGIRELECKDNVVYIRNDKEEAEILVDEQWRLRSDEGICFETYVGSSESMTEHWNVGLRLGDHDFYFSPGVGDSVCISDVTDGEDLGFIPAPNVLHKVQVFIRQEDVRIVLTNGENPLEKWEYEFEPIELVRRDGVIPRRTIGWRMENSNLESDARVAMFSRMVSFQVGNVTGTLAALNPEVYALRTDNGELRGASKINGGNELTKQEEEHYENANYLVILPALLPAILPYDFSFRQMSVCFFASIEEIDFNEEDDSENGCIVQFQNVMLTSKILNQFHLLENASEMKLYTIVCRGNMTVLHVDDKEIKRWDVSEQESLLPEDFGDVMFGCHVDKNTEKCYKRMTGIIRDMRIYDEALKPEQVVKNFRQLSRENELDEVLAG